MKLITILLYALLSVFPFTLKAQNFFLHKYGDEHGLKSNLVKAIDQDKSGFLWVATDAGLARFDGKQFINITNNFPSLFVKDVLVTSDNKIIVVTDLGVGLLKLKDGNYEYFNLIEGKPEEKVGFLYYPKAAFEDINNNIWISDNTGLTKYKNGKFTKYRFDDKFATDDYLNSFWITEDNAGNIYASSWQGYLFYFDKTEDKFLEIPITNKVNNYFINQISFVDNYIIAATSIGLVKLNITNNTATNTLLLQFINTICFYQDYDKFYIGGVEGGIFEWNGKSDKAIPILGNNINSIVNYMYPDIQNNIWACTDEGIVLLQKSSFAEYRLSHNAFDNTRYIRTLSSDGLNNIYFTDQENILKINNSQFQSSPEIVFYGNGKRIYNFAVNENLMWISTRSSELFLKSGNSNKKFTIEGLNFRISGMAINSKNGLFGLMENTNNVIKIYPDFTYKIYKIDNLTSSKALIKCIDDKIYVLNFTDKINIIIYDENNDTFKELNLTHQIKYPRNVTINDFVKLKDNSFLLATNIGVLNYNNNFISFFFEKDHLLTNNAKAISVAPNGQIWFGTENGLVLFYINEFAVFNRVDGLPNTVITPSGLYLDNSNKIWVATSSGLAYWQKPNTNIEKTPKPVIYSAFFKGKQLDITSKFFDVTGKGTIVFNYAALVYPANKRYQFRIIGWQDEWSELTEYESQSFINLPQGNYVLQIRAKQFGYLWSDIAELRFTI
ncbi:MAG TPA: triple tyrosine motif-containing protein, partial [Melioribacteraceae bacterium]|nr:triple tyrosine motif-containing protein [Melioribacteraceae bacterium]